MSLSFENLSVVFRMSLHCKFVVTIAEEFVLPQLLELEDWLLLEEELFWLPCPQGYCH